MCSPAVFEVVQTLRARGVGRQLQRFTWPDNSFWTLTAIQPALVSALLPLAPFKADDTQSPCACCGYGVLPVFSCFVPMGTAHEV